MPRQPIKNTSYYGRQIRPDVEHAKIEIDGDSEVGQHT